MKKQRRCEEGSERKKRKNRVTNKWKRTLREAQRVRGR